MAFGSDVRMCMWSDIPPNFYGNGIQTAYYAADILEYAWQVFAAHISAIVLYMENNVYVDFH